MSELFMDEYDGRKLLIIENAKLRFKNFRGEPDKYNPEGRASFNVDIMDEKAALEMQKDGWNVRENKDQNGEVVGYRLPVVLGDKYPPKIFLYTPDGTKVEMPREDYPSLDDTYLDEVGLAISPKYWTNDEGETKIKAYLSQMNVLIVPNRLDKNWEKKFN